MTGDTGFMLQDRTARDLGAFADVDTAEAGDFISRLDKMRTMESFKAYKDETYALLDLKPDAKVIDIGCGTGDDSRMLAEFVGSGGEVVGLDFSEAMIAEAKNRFRDCEQLVFVQGSADDLPFDDAVFDAVRVDRVLIHVPDPDKAIDELLRVLKPGGRIVVSEPDMPGAWLDTEHLETAQTVIGAVARSCTTPLLARQMWNRLRARGLSDADFTVRTATAFDLETVNQTLAFGDVIERLAGAGAIAVADAQAFGADLHQRNAEGRFLAALDILITSATKP